VHPLAVERFCERVLAEVNQVSRESTRSYHERYRQIFKIIQERDQEIARIFDNPRRSQAKAEVRGSVWPHRVLIIISSSARVGALRLENSSSVSRLSLRIWASMISAPKRRRPRSPKKRSGSAAPLY
jgi:hypothetical protein